MTTESPPTGVDDGRKARINNEIVRLCSKKAASDTDPTLYGVGLYTHTATVSKASDPPVTSKPDVKLQFLPIDGPNKTCYSKQQSNLDKEVAAVYKELQRAVEAEEKVSNAEIKPLPYLKLKYGNPTTATPLAGAMSQLAIGDRGMKRRHSEVAGGKASGPQPKRRVSFAPGTATEPRRKSVGDSSMLAKELEGIRRGSGSQNIYNEDRDPRRKGR